MSSPRVVEPSLEDLRSRWRELLSRTSMSRHELEEAAAAGKLSPDEFWLWEDVRAVEFLLGEDVER